MEKDHLPPALILAGGRASRWGGADKALMPYEGASFLGRVIGGLAPQVSGMAISANGDPARFDAFGLPVLADPIDGQLGPLAGVLAGMQWAGGLGYSSLVTVPVDCPVIPRDLVARLMAAPAAVVLAMAPDEEGIPRRQPTFARWPTALAPQLEDALRGGLRKIGQFAQEQDLGFAHFEEPFLNLNSASDLANAILAGNG